MAAMKKTISAAKDAGLTAVIASDISAIQYANEIGLEVHISTQTNVSNIEAVKFFANYADVIVLARELTLPQIKKIGDKIKEEKIIGPNGELVRIELFAHGALCVAVSGKCYMSLGTHNASANRGACLQNCRKSYRVIDEETGVELKVDNKYIMSPKDLCTIGFIDQLLEAGVSVFKLEGRGRSADYVYTVTKAYREAVESYQEGTYTDKKVKAWITELEKVFNRGFWHGGYYLGKKLGEWSGEYGSQSTVQKTLVGRALKYFSNIKVAELRIESGEINTGDKIMIVGPTTGLIQIDLPKMRLDEKDVNQAKKGDIITIPLDKKVRKSDKIFLMKEKK